MDRIYAEASLVIIAAAGDDPNYGLPGVSDRVRVPQKVVNVGKCKLVEMLVDMKSTLSTTKWWSRAW
jgi:hypothetical protein